MIRMTVYAGRGPDDDATDYRPSCVVHMVAERDLSEELRKLGVEWRQADYFPTRQTVITLDPVPEPSEVDVRGLVREAADKLERTGLL